MQQEGLSIDIDKMGNAAFSEDPRAEIHRILRDIAGKVLDGSEGGTIMDINGNKVGSWGLTLPEPEEDEEDE